MGGGGGASVAAGALLTAELCAPLLLLCGLCCWPLDDRSDTSSTGKGKHPQKPVVLRESSRPRSRCRRPSEVFSHKAANSDVSLHLPSTSGHSKQSLAAHRSHEEIRSRRQSHLEAQEPDEEGRYHSAPSVIDEVLHRRDWERSSRELYIPLRPEAELSDRDSDFSSPPAPHAEAESSSIECIHKEEKVSCKKHYTNIKSSRNRTTKERNQDDVKDTDATENEASSSSFYIGEASNEASVINKENNKIKDVAGKIKSVYKAKDAKQSFNESIKYKERPHVTSDFDNTGPFLEGYQIKAVDIDLDVYVDDLDRSGAMHRDSPPDSLTTVISRMEVFPAPSVEAVGWEGGACYLPEGGRERGARAQGDGAPARARGRHASDGDLLQPALRPESGAFSESDLELELESAAERPPPYEDLHLQLQPLPSPAATAPLASLAADARKETAV